MPNPRTYTDAQLREAVAASTNWSQVLVAIGKKPGSGSKGVKLVAARLDLDTSHFAYKQSFRPLPGCQLPFSRPVQLSGRSGLSIAARWFLDRGYLVSVPLEPAPYDLITESDAGLQRVQVKVTSQRGSSHRYVVNLGHMIRDPAIKNANGSRRRVSYTPEQVDYFFVVTPDSLFLIPISSVETGQISVTLDVKYGAFSVLSP